MTAVMTDNELRSKCFRALVDCVGYWGAERFIVLMNREPGDYTAWRAVQPDAEGTIEELGEKITAFERAHNRASGQMAAV